MTVSKRLAFGLILVVISTFIYANNFVPMKKPQKSKWSLQMGFETNYTGNNGFLHAGYSIKKHKLEAGVNYNFSDGFAANPVLGIDLSYSYKVVESYRWSASIGLDYRRQKPLKIVNIQLLNYTTGVTYKWMPKLYLTSKLGYGLAAERAASAGSFAQSNNISGSFQFGCVYRFVSY